MQSMEDQIQRYTNLVIKWQKSINLIGPATLPDIKRRHVDDSFQLLPHLPKDVSQILDLGSGGGFPAMIIAIASSHQVHMTESDQRKSIFLREAIRELGLKNAQVHHARIEHILTENSSLEKKFDVITARACTDLSTLFSYAKPFMQANAICLFLKGANYNMELESAAKGWQFEHYVTPSQTDASGVILKISDLTRKTP